MELIKIFAWACKWWVMDNWQQRKNEKLKVSKGCREAKQRRLRPQYFFGKLYADKHLLSSRMYHWKRLLTFTFHFTLLVFYTFFTTVRRINNKITNSWMYDILVNRTLKNNWFNEKYNLNIQRHLLTVGEEGGRFVLSWQNERKFLNLWAIDTHRRCFFILFYAVFIHFTFILYYFNHNVKSDFTR